ATPVAAPAAAAGTAGTAPDAAGGEAAADEKPTSGEVFLALFKHLEPHAVFAVWFGGQHGFGFVKPYIADPATGEPALKDKHGHPVLFTSRAELVDHYQAGFGGGTGYVVWNITTAQWIAAAIVLIVMLIIARR